jgi:hypothetical protein
VPHFAELVVDWADCVIANLPGRWTTVSSDVCKNAAVSKLFDLADESLALGPAHPNLLLLIVASSRGLASNDDPASAR